MADEIRDVIRLKVATEAGFLAATKRGMRSVAVDTLRLLTHDNDSDVIIHAVSTDSLQCLLAGIQTITGAKTFTAPLRVNNKIGINCVPGTMVELQDTAPILKIQNTTPEDIAGGRAIEYIFQGRDSSNTLINTASIRVESVGTGAEAKLILSVHDSAELDPLIVKDFLVLNGEDDNIQTLNPLMVTSHLLVQNNFTFDTDYIYTVIGQADLVTAQANKEDIDGRNMINWEPDGSSNIYVSFLNFALGGIYLIYNKSSESGYIDDGAGGIIELTGLTANLLFYSLEGIFYAI